MYLTRRYTRAHTHGEKWLGGYDILWWAYWQRLYIEESLAIRYHRGVSRGLVCVWCVCVWCVCVCMCVMCVCVICVCVICVCVCVCVCVLHWNPGLLESQARTPLPSLVGFPISLVQTFFSFPPISIVKTRNQDPPFCPVFDHGPTCSKISTFSTNLLFKL